MITEFLLNIVFGLLSGAFSLLPDITFSLESSVYQYFIDIVKVAAYMLPMNTVSAIVSLIIQLTIIRIVIAFFTALWNVLPVV